jgi:hypothetical protein
MKTLFGMLFVSFLLALPACVDSARDDGMAAAEQARLENGPHATPRSDTPGGAYFIGRRYYKEGYKFWGFVRKPEESWGAAKLVIFNEKQKLAPDRARGQIGFDNNYEYKLYGYFSGDTPYEVASNNWYPEFVLTGYELISVSRPPLLTSPTATDSDQHATGPSN